MQSIGQAFFSSDQKYRPLKKNSEMIQMKNIKKNVHGDYEYQTFVQNQPSIQEDFRQLPPNRVNHNNYPKQLNLNNIPSSINFPSYSIPNVPYQNPYYNHGENDMVLNGMKFKVVEKIESQQKKPLPKTHKKGIPQMSVTCVFCMKDQRVEGTAEQYKCYHCGNNNGCTPMFNIVRCHNCKTKVCYRYFTSDLVKCTKCEYVNKVPKWANNTSSIQQQIAPKRYQPIDQIDQQKSMNYLIEYPEFLSENQSEKRTGRG